MLASASTVEINCHVNHTMCGRICFGKIFLSKHQAAMNVAVADVPTGEKQATKEELINTGVWRATNTSLMLTQASAQSAHAL